MRVSQSRYVISAETLDSMLALLVVQNLVDGIRSTRAIDFAVDCSHKISEAFDMTEQARCGGLVLFSRRIPQA